MGIIDGLWNVLLDFLTHPATQGIAVAVVSLMSAMTAFYVLPDFVAESTLLPRATTTATILRVVVVLAGAAAFAAAAAVLVIALPRP
jgi:hypothetical protein